MVLMARNGKWSGRLLNGQKWSGRLLNGQKWSGSLLWDMIRVLVWEWMGRSNGKWSWRLLNGQVWIAGTMFNAFTQCLRHATEDRSGVRNPTGTFDKISWAPRDAEDHL